MAGECGTEGMCPSARKPLHGPAAGATVPKQHLPATERALAWLAALHDYEQLAASHNEGIECTSGSCVGGDAIGEFNRHIVPVRRTVPQKVRVMSSSA